MRRRSFRLYTFFLEYKGGTYIYQSEGQTLQEALRTWAEDLPGQKIVGTDKTFKMRLKEEVEDSIHNQGITPIEGVTNVWCTTFMISDKAVGVLTITITSNARL